MFRVPGPGEQGEFITRTGIMRAIGWNPVLRLNINNIGPAMKELGFPRMRTESERPKAGRSQLRSVTGVSTGIPLRSSKRIPFSPFKPSEVAS